MWKMSLLPGVPRFTSIEGLVIIDAEEAYILYILYSLKLLVVSSLDQQGPLVIYKTIWTCWTQVNQSLMMFVCKFGGT